MKDNDIEIKLDLPQQLFAKFLETSRQDKQIFQESVEKFKKTVNFQYQPQDSPRDFPNTSITNRYEGNRRSPIFFGSPLHSPQNKAQIQETSSMTENLKFVHSKTP